MTGVTVNQPATLATAIAAMQKRASAFYEAGNNDAAIQLALDIVALDSTNIEARLTAAHALRESGRFRESLKVLQHVIALDPACVRAHAASALALFCLEDWHSAWRAYEVRFKLMENPPRVTRPGADGNSTEMPMWRGGAIPAHILVLGEQGLGDTLQFARYLPQLRQAGAKVTCVVPRGLFRLLRTLDVDIDWRPAEVPGTVAGIKAWLPLLHLPFVLGLTPAQFTGTVPYLSAEPTLVEQWRARIGTHGFRIGIVWQGNPDPRIDSGRSAPLTAFAPLAQLPGVRLISLQHGHGTAQLEGAGFPVEVPGPLDSGDDRFIDTAALMQCLDLVVTVDTSIAHLAGALGVRTFILLKTPAADWRWLHGREDTLWYPTARLFRQQAPGDWRELLQRVARAAQTLLPAAPLLLQAPIAVGELIDKITILQIKSERINDAGKVANVQRELAALEATRLAAALDGERIAAFTSELKAINTQLWDIEDAIRLHEARADFSESFVALARSVYQVNDRRAQVKHAINREFGSGIVEEKSYAG